MEEDSASKVVLHPGLMSVEVEAGSRDAGTLDYGVEQFLMPPPGQLPIGRHLIARKNLAS